MGLQGSGQSHHLKLWECYKHNLVERKLWKEKETRRNSFDLPLEEPEVMYPGCPCCIPLVWCLLSLVVDSAVFGPESLENIGQWDYTWSCAFLSDLEKPIDLNYFHGHWVFALMSWFISGKPPRFSFFSFPPHYITFHLKAQRPRTLAANSGTIFLNCFWWKKLLSEETGKADGLKCVMSFPHSHATHSLRPNRAEVILLLACQSGGNVCTFWMLFSS